MLCPHEIKCHLGSLLSRRDECQFKEIQKYGCKELWMSLNDCKKETLHNERYGLTNSLFFSKVVDTRTNRYKITRELLLLKLNLLKICDKNYAKKKRKFKEKFCVNKLKKF